MPLLSGDVNALQQSKQLSPILSSFSFYVAMEELISR